ncbi:MAG TPA: tripartite tricarboxylate transporter substrate binding protein [Burkholderiales bacterium]|nr:tripartite tricarboxylate transporter substrate binding protein [Burkholderiales bacterium]
MRHKNIDRAFIVAAAMVFSCVGWTQTYPAKPIRLVVPQAPGGGNDTIARLIGQRLSQTLKQQLLVDNRAGAGGLIGAENVAKSPPDGYTLLLGNVATLAIIPNVQKKVPYDPLKDFEPVSLIATAPLLVVVHPSLPVTSVKQLIALAKAKPGQLNYASNGVGSSTHLATELFKVMTGTDMTHVPYKGLGPATTDLLSGQVQVMFSSAVAMVPHVKANRLRPIAITGAKRSRALPEIPTVAEAGVRDYEAGSWYGILAPAGTDRAIVDLLAREIAAATRTPEIQNRLGNEGVIPVGGTPSEFASHIRKEHARVAQVVKTSGAKFE